MMTVIYFCLVILLFANKNKTIRYAAFFLLLILFCFNTDNADRGIYEYRLTEYENLTGITEPGYYLLMSVFNLLHLDIQIQYVITGLLYLTSLFYIITKISKNPNIVIGYYMFAVFFLDVVQLRATTSLIFVLWALYYLLTIEDTKKSVIIFLLLIFASALFHSSSLFFGVFALIKIKSRKNLIIYVLICFVILSVAEMFFISYIGNALSVTDKIEAISQSDKYKGNNANIVAIVLLIGMLSAYLILYSLYGKRYDKYKNIITRNNIPILLLLVIPLISFSADFRRIYFAVSPFLVSTITCWINKNNGFVIKSFIFVWGGIFFYRLILHGNYDAVFIPIMYDNMIYKVF